MNIIFMTHSFPSEVHPVDGIFNQQRIQALMKQGHRVKCLLFVSVTPKFKHFFPVPMIGRIYTHLEERLKLTNEYHYNEVHVIRLKRISPPYKMFWGDDHRFVKFFNGRKIRELIFEFAPALIISSGMNPGSALAKMVKKIVDVPFFAILEGSDALLTYKQYRGVDKIIAMLNRYADKVIFVSESMKRDVTKRFRVNNSVVIKNGYDKSLFAYHPDQKTRNDSLYRIVSVGNFNYVKGHDILLKSLFGIGIPYKLTLIGDGGKEKEYREIIRANKLNVELIPNLPQKELRKHLDACDLFCMPSRSESFGITAVEAMACGVPVVASNIGGLAENIIDGFNGYLFKTESVEALRSATEKARSTDWSKEDIAKWTAEHFSWDKWATEVLQMIL